MRQIVIDAKQLPPTSRYLQDKQNKRDLIGQIIIQLGHRLPNGLLIRTPCQLDFAVDPITTYTRQTVVLTCTGFNLLMVTNLPASQQIPAANRLLSPHNIQIIPPPENWGRVVDTDKRSSILQEIQQFIGSDISPDMQTIIDNGIAANMSAEEIADILAD